MSAVNNSHEDGAAPAAALTEVNVKRVPADSTKAFRTDSGSTSATPKPQKWPTSSRTATLVPSNCVVLKNLDYNINQDSLAEVVRRVMTGRRDFVNMSLVTDKATDTFRGMAFVTFASVPDATAALTELGNVVINGRKVIAEFRRARAADRKESALLDKRPKKSAEVLAPPPKPHEADGGAAVSKTVDKRALFFANRDTERRAGEHRRQEKDAAQTDRDRAREVEFRKLLSDYVNGALHRGPDDVSRDTEDEGTTKDMVFDTSLTPFERRIVHRLCDELQLGHISRVDAAGHRVLHVTRDADRAAEWARETPPVVARNDSTSSWPKGKGVAAKEAGKRRNVRDNGAPKPGVEATPRANRYTPRCGKTGDDAGSGGLRPPSYKVYTPKGKPTGPDGTGGFHARRAYHGLEAEVETGVDAADDGSGDVRGKGGDGGVSNGGGDMETGRKKVVSGRNGGGPVAKGKGGGGKGRKTAPSGLNPSVPAFAPISGEPYVV